MESVLSPPQPFSYDGNSVDLLSGSLNDMWTKWTRNYDIYTKACEIIKKPVDVQFNIFLHVVGEQCREILNQGGENTKTVEGALKKLDDHFKCKKNVTVERHKFFSREQIEGETIDQYVFELRRLSQSCEFKNMNEELIKDRLVCGVNSANIRERLLREEDLTLKKALEICRAAVVSRIYSENIKKEMQPVFQVHNEIQESDDEIYAIRRFNEVKRRGYFRVASSQRGRGRGSWSGARAHSALYPQGAGFGADGNRSTSSYENRRCNSCGGVHQKNDCPAYGRKCMRCSKMNHFAKMCRVFFVDNSNEQVSNINCINSWDIDLIIKGQTLNFKLDTGADVNVLPLKYLLKIGLKETDLLSTNTKLTAYSGNTIQVLGKIYLRVSYKNKNYVLQFKIADVQSIPILGRDACTELDVVRRVMSIQKSVVSNEIVPTFLEQYGDVFTGLGCLPGKYKIKLRENSVPVVHAPRKLPFSIKDQVKNKLSEMECQGIISKVEGPSDWVSSITVVKKPNGDLRICLDPKELNESIKREHFRIPTLEEIVGKLAGAKYFSTLDASNGFWQVLLDDSSSLCTFNTPFGRYKFLRMPYGICSASEVFHKKMFENFDDLEGVCMYIDDLLIFGSCQSSHDKNLMKVLERCRKINLKLNLSKCKFGVKEIKYLGHLITNNGIYPDNSHISAITNMPTPKDKKDVERLLGLLTYVGSFIPSLSDKTLALRELLKKGTEWQWYDRQDKCFSEIKKLLSSRPVLQYFDMRKSIVMSVDASKTGLGACLLQDNLPVCYASKTLNSAEQKYAQIEKELYAVLFACEKFYVYIHGRSDIVIETDHKPLISIMKKPIVDSPARLQRMLLRLQRYTFKLVYKPGKYMYIADTLSRAHEADVSTKSALSHAAEHSFSSVHDEVCEVTRDMMAQASHQFDDVQLIRIQKHTEKDDELKSLKQYIMNGWPSDKNKIINEVKPYWNYKENLTETFGIVWKDQRIVIPKILRKEILKKLHIGHMGLEKCKLRARESVFWPGLNNDLQNMIHNCDICLSHRKNCQKETLQLHDIPDRPWAKVGTDLFHFKHKNYLILIDYYSKFFEVVELQITSSDYIIGCMKDIFSRQGIPCVVMSDCGPQFSSHNFRQFSSEWNFTHITSSPHYPQSNGQVERTVQTVKNIMRKSSENRTDYRLAFLEYLNTPLADDIPSPAELLQSRKLRSIIPMSLAYLKPKIQKCIHNKIVNRQIKQKMYYDRNAKDLCSLHVGQKVKILQMNNICKRRWLAGTVTRVLRNRSYEVQLTTGVTIIRNRRHIIIDSPQRQDTPDYNFDQDDTMLTDKNVNTNIEQNSYTTRSGRLVRPPDRWGYTH